jgi:hypothetical protein
MPSKITCPLCRGLLRIHDDLYGQRVQCPTCNKVFVADESTGAPHRTVQDQPSQGTAVDPEFEDAERQTRWRRQWLQRHRGPRILALGIVGLAVCTPLGIAAWVMGNNDLEAMRRGEMDSSGEGLAQAGRICGMVGTALFALQCLCVSVGAYIDHLAQIRRP